MPSFLRAIAAGMLSVVLFAVPAARAQVIVSFCDGQAVASSSQTMGEAGAFSQAVGDWDGDSLADDFRVALLFDPTETIAISPPINPGVYPNPSTSTSARFFGGVYSYCFDDTTTRTLGRTIATGTSPTHTITGAGGSGTEEQDVLIYWPKSEFLNGADAIPNLTFTAQSSLKFQSMFLQAGHTGPARWVVRNGMQFYVSDQVLYGTNGVYTHYLIGVEILNMRWKPYNPNVNDISFSNDERLSGTLTTRVDANTGQITLDNPAHGLTTADTIDVFWNNDRNFRFRMKITAVAGSVISIDGGTDFIQSGVSNLPGVLTGVEVVSFTRGGVNLPDVVFGSAFTDVTAVGFMADGKRADNSERRFRWRGFTAAISGGLNSLTVNQASYFGGDGDDAINEAAMAPNGDAIFAGRMTSANPPGVYPVHTYFGGGEGVIVRFNTDTNTIVWLARVPGNVLDVEMTRDGQRLVAAVEDFGAIVLDGDGAYLWNTNIRPVERASIGQDYHVAVVTGVERNWRMTLYSDAGVAMGSQVSGRSFVEDILVDSGNRLVMATGYNVGNTGLEPMHTPFIYCWRYDNFDTRHWTGYDFPASTYRTIGHPAFGNVGDSRGYRVVIGNDDLLYFIGESHGGNTPFSFDPLIDTLPIGSKFINIDSWSSGTNTGATPITTITRMNPYTGELERLTRLMARLTSTYGNTCRGRGLMADERSQVYVTGSVNFAIRDRTPKALNDVANGPYVGTEGFLSIFNPTFDQRLTWSVFTFSDGTPATSSNTYTYGLAARNGRAVAAGRITNSTGQVLTFPGAYQQARNAGREGHFATIGDWAPTPTGTATALSALPASDTEISLAWTDTHSDEDGYTIERRDGLKTFRRIARLPSGSESFLDTSLDPGTTYTYRVLAHRDATYGSSYGDPSNESSATTTGTAPAPLPSAAFHWVHVIEPGGWTYIVEDGATDTFDVYLNTDPGATVTINLLAQTGIVCTPSVLTFNAGEFGPGFAQTVTISAPENGIVEEPVYRKSISFTVSSSGVYNARPVSPVRVYVEDSGAGGSGLLIWTNGDDTGEWNSVDQNFKLFADNSPAAFAAGNGVRFDNSGSKLVSGLATATTVAIREGGIDTPVSPLSFIINNSASSGGNNWSYTFVGGTIDAGQIFKQGTGTATFSGYTTSHGFAGDVNVDGGSLIFSTGTPATPVGLTLGFGQGTIYVNNATFRFNSSRNGSASALPDRTCILTNPLVFSGSAPTLEIGHNNNSRTAFGGPITVTASTPTLTINTGAGGGTGIDGHYVGQIGSTLTLATGERRIIRTGNGNTNLYLAADIGESGGPATLRLRNTGGRALHVIGENNSYSGGTIIEAAGSTVDPNLSSTNWMVIVSGDGKLGVGDVTVQPGGGLRFSNNLPLEPNADLELQFNDVSFQRGLLMVDAGLRVRVNSLTIHDITYTSGVFNSSTHPDYIYGGGEIVVNVPFVSVEVVDGEATESPADSAVIRVARSGFEGVELDVAYAMSGTAVNGVDYVLLSGVATIPVDAFHVDISIDPIDDMAFTGSRSVTLTALPSALGIYTLAPGQTSGTIKLFDDDGSYLTFTAPAPDPATSAQPWDLANTFWRDDGPPAPTPNRVYTDGSVVSFVGSVGHRLINIPQNVSPRGIDFNVGSSGSDWTIDIGSNQILSGFVSKSGSRLVLIRGDVPQPFPGGTSVTGGTLRYRLNNPATGGAYQFGSGPITLSGGTFSFGAGSGTFSFTNPLIVGPAAGTFNLSGNGTGMNATVSGDIDLAADLTLSHSDNNLGSAPVYSGQVTLTGDRQILRTGTGGHDLQIAGNIVDADINSPSTLTLRNTGGTIFRIQGPNNSFAGGAVIGSSGRTVNAIGGNTNPNSSSSFSVQIQPGTRLGRGNVSVLTGGYLRLMGDATITPRATLSLQNTANGAIWVNTGVTVHVASLVIDGVPLGCGEYTNTTLGIYGPGSIRVRRPGDFDNNCAVNAIDLAVLLSKVGGPALETDLDGSGSTDADDAAVLTAEYGVTP